MNEIVKVFNYNGSPIQFEIVDGHVMANATMMCSSFGKLAKDWLKTDQTKRYVDTIRRKILLTENQLVVVRNGGNYPGTWIHEKLILNLARWLSIEFELWCDEKIAQLLREGKVELSPTNLSRMDILKLAMEAEKENIRLREENAKLKPAADYALEVMKSDTCYNATSVAKELGISALRLNRILVILQVQYKNQSHYVLFSRYQNKGYHKFETSFKYDKEGNTKTYTQMVWTERGRAWVKSKVKPYLEKKKELAGS